jgi:hypothetical protein
MSDLFAARGKRLWESLLAQDESLSNEQNPMREVAISACRTADRVEELERIAMETDPVIESRGALAMHPVHGEVRQQAALLARLVTALRLPDEATGKRPQGRGMRGVQKPSATGRVSSLDAARARAVGK